MGQSLRDKLRKKALVDRKPRAAEIVNYDGEEFEVRQPSVGMRSNIILGAGAKVAKSEEELMEGLDTGKIQILSVIHCTYVPGTDEKVFELGDYAMLEDDAPGGLVDTLSAVAMKLINVKPETDAKNSESPQDTLDS